MGGGPNNNAPSGGIQAFNASVLLRDLLSAGPVHGKNGGGKVKPGKSRADPPSPRLKAFYYPHIADMIKNPDTPVTFQAKPTVRKLLKVFMQGKCLGAAPPTEKGAQEFLAVQDGKFTKAFGFYMKAEVIRYKNTESKCIHSAWKKADREGATAIRGELQKEAEKSAGHRVIIPHPAGADHKKAQVWG